jgi:hypothetical protein
MVAPLSIPSRCALARTDAQRAWFLNWKRGKEFYFAVLRAAHF